MHVCVPHACSACAGRKKVANLLGLELTHDCEPPCWCRELDLCPLEEQLMLSTAEPSLQSPLGAAIAGLVQTLAFCLTRFFICVCGRRQPSWHTCQGQRVTTRILGVKPRLSYLVASVLTCWDSFLSPPIPLCMGVRVRVQAEGQLWVSLGMTWLGCLDGESRVSLASAFLPLGLQVYLQS